MSWVYVPGSEAWNSPSELLPEDARVSYAQSSGTPTPQPLSWRGWLTRSWIKRLSGTISRPSMARRGVASWIASLQVGRAKTTAWPGDAKAWTARAADPSGVRSFASFAKWSRTSSCWRTSQASVLGSEKFSEIWPLSGSMRSGACFERTLLVPLTGARVSSWLRGEYPTPAATPYGSSRNEGEVPHDRPSRGTPSLETWAHSWATPCARDGDPRRAGAEPKKTKGGRSLAADLAHSWPTATATDWKGSSRPGQRRRQLCEIAEHGPRQATPGSNGELFSIESHSSRLQYPTPTAGDAKASGSRNTATSRANMVVSLTDLVTTGDSAGRAGAKVHLNPLFVEWLMGFPICWALPFTYEEMRSGAWASRSSPSKPQPRSSSSRVEESDNPFD